MRIPHIINENTIQVYKPSAESLDLIDENERQLVAENIEWNKYDCPTLIDFCVQQINTTFKEKAIINELPCADRNYLLELLAVDLPLDLVIPLISDEFYWEKRYKAHFGVVLRRKPIRWNWKSLYIERHLQQVIEDAQPQHNDEENIEELLKLCGPFIKRLIITQLQPWKPPLTWEADDIPEVYPIAHINFGPIFDNLPLLREFSLRYGLNGVGETFTFDMFKLSVNDCEKLGEAILRVPSLRIFRLTQSRIEDCHAQALCRGISRNTTLNELDLSNCQIGDDGALCLAKVLSVHPTLKHLNLTNNYIGGRGATGIGFVLVDAKSAPLEVLNFRLNPLSHEGVMAIMRALVRTAKLVQVSFAGCEFEEETALRVGDMLKVNRSLMKLDVSNNYFDVAGGEALISALQVNNTLQWLEFRETDITKEQLVKINKALLRNRTGIEDDEILEECNENVSELVHVIDSPTESPSPRLEPEE